MSLVKEIADLCIALRDEAKKEKNLDLVEKAINIEVKVKELSDENDELRKQLDITSKIKYDDNSASFILINNPNVHYCSTCYGQNNKLIPMIVTTDGKYKCRICEEIWMGKIRGGN